MEHYSLLADLLHTFRTMSDGVKVLLIYMPCVFGLGAMALYLYHLRHKNMQERDDTAQPFQGTLLPPDDRPWLNRTWADKEHHPSLETLRKLNDHVARWLGAIRLGNEVEQRLLDPG